MSCLRSHTPAHCPVEFITQQLQLAGLFNGFLIYLTSPLDLVSLTTLSQCPLAVLGM